MAPHDASARHTRIYLTIRFPLEARTKCLGSLRLAFLLAISAHLDMLEICFACVLDVIARATVETTRSLEHVPVIIGVVGLVWLGGALGKCED